MSILSVKRCILCQSDTPKSLRTHEHIVPDWMLSHFGITDRNTTQALWPTVKGGPSGHRSHTWGNFVIRDLCKICNNEFLSQLEESAKPILLAASSQERQLADLTHKEQLTLSRWAVKTALLLHQAALFKRVIPLNLLHHFYSHRQQLPTGLSVFGLQTPQIAGTGPINFIQSQKWTCYTSYGDAIESFSSLRDACKISLRIDQLHLLVCYLGNPAFESVGWRKVHRPIWPTQCRLWFDSYLDHSALRQRLESDMVMFHVSLLAAWNASQKNIDKLPQPRFEQAHDELFDLATQEQNLPSE